MNHDQKHHESTASTSAVASCLKSTGKGAKRRRGGILVGDEEAEADEDDEEEDGERGSGRPPAPLNSSYARHCLRFLSSVVIRVIRRAIDETVEA